MKRLAAILACALFLALAQVSLAQSASAADSPWADPILRTRVEPALLKQLLTATPGQHIPLIVEMNEPAVPVLNSTALVPSLQATAERTQADIRTFLAREETAGRAEAVRAFWIFNGLSLHASSDTALALARRHDVALIRLDHWEQRLAPNEVNAAETTSTGLAWGVERVRANLVWSALNVTGEGVVVANMDTGVDLQHPALKANYRGNLGKNLWQNVGNWFDATDGGALYPIDANGHGTHTMGTIAGQEGIGVAPGVRWIAARILNSQGMGYDSWIHAGFQWLLAPGGDPKLAPQVVNNSWNGSEPASTEFQNDLARLRQAGIVVIFSNGNTGPEPGSVVSPASLPGIFSVGASDNDDEVASFSSRGPSVWGQVKPLVVAPGVNVRSSLPGGIYGLASGTSMAAPHVAGIAALMLSINPRLTVTATEYALTSTTVSLSATVPNNDSGWGRVDAYAAVQAAAGAGVIEGRVLDRDNRLPLSGARVTLIRSGSGTRFVTDTDPGGYYRAGGIAGSYNLVATQFGYEPDSVGPVMIVTATTTLQDLILPPLPTGVLQGNLTDAANSHPATVTVSVLNTPVAQTAYGQYHLNLPAGTYDVQARGLGYRVVTTTVTITPGQVTQLNFGLAPAPRMLLVNSGAWYYDDQSSHFRQSLDGLAYSYDERRIKHPLTDIPTADDLLKYDLVIWSSPQDSPGLVSAVPAITRYLKSGGRLILTGQDVAFWDAGPSGLPVAPYLHDDLKTSFMRDDAGTRYVLGKSDDILAGLFFGISGGTGANNQGWPDEIALTDPDYGAEILHYQGAGSAGNRVGLCLPYRAVFLSFGFEAIDSRASQQEVMRRSIDYLFGPPASEGFAATKTSPDVQVGQPGTVVTFTMRVKNNGEGGATVNFKAGLEPAAWSSVITPTQFSLAPCATEQLTVTSRVPPGTGIDVRKVLTVTVAPLDRPAAAQVITLTAKAPAPVLLVDHHRWYNVLDAYTQALRAAGVGYDLWTLPPNGTEGLTAAQMSAYPLVVWFTGYDWYQPLSSSDESQLSKYLDNGGRLMLSSVFYTDQRGTSAFARDRLGVLSYSTGFTATQAISSPGHPLAAGLDKAELIDPFPRASFFTLDDTVTPTEGAATAWRGGHYRPLAITRSEPGNRLVFWAIPFEALATESRNAILSRTLGWLGALGRSAVRVEPASVASGQPATVTLVLTNDLAPSPVSMVVTLPPGTQPDGDSLPPGLAYDVATNSLHYKGALDKGATVSFAFRLLTAGAAPGRLTGKVVFRDEKLGTNYDQPLEVAIRAPDLASSSLQVGPSRGGRPATVTMRLRNDGLGVAETASVVGVLPLGARVVADSIQVDGPGTAVAGTAGIVWQGALAPGQTATITCQVTPSSSKQLLAMPIEMLIWDGAGGAWERRAWLAVQPNSWWFPLVGGG